MKTITINNINYNIIENYKNAFDEKEFEKRYTDYFEPYDYIVGDIAYGSLRLKGFYNPKNKKANKINNYKYVEEYLKNNCAVECKYFILEKNKE